MTLHLLPNLLSDQADPSLFFPPELASVMARIDGLIAESEQGGRRYLKRFQTKRLPHHMPIARIQDPHDFLLAPLVAGEEWGVLSDAGLPCLADPGAQLVRYAHSRGIPVRVYSGPSSITWSLLASGLPGQRFAFHGYLSKQPSERQKQIKELGKRARQEKATQIFIEAPYRNEATLRDCLAVLEADLMLCVASELTGPQENITTQPVGAWKRQPVTIEKVPTIFLISIL